MSIFDAFGLNNTRFTAPDRAASTPFKPNDIYLGEVTRIEGSTAWVKFPRIIPGDFELGPLQILNAMPEVGDEVACIFRENRADDPIVVGRVVDDAFQLIDRNVIDALGDLMVGTGPDEVGRLGLGGVNTVLVVDPAAEYGLSYKLVNKDMIDDNLAGVGLIRSLDGALMVQTDETSMTNAGDFVSIKDSGVTTVKIADANVTTAKIADANVTTAKIADANVTTAKIADANVTTAKIADANVTTVKLADLNVTTGKLADDAVTSAKIAADVAGDGLVQNVSGALDVNVDNSTIEINADTLRVRTIGVPQGGTGITSYTSGDLIYASATGTAPLARLAAGTANQVVGMNAAGTAPEYKSISASAGGIVVAHTANTVTVGTTQDLTTAGTPSFTRLTLSQAAGTAPMTVASTTVVTNLNADLLDGQEGTFYLSRANQTGTLSASAGGTGVSTYTSGDLLYASATGTTPLARLPLGTANQVLGVNNAGTSPEYKTITSTAASASGLTVAHTANTVTLTLPQSLATTSTPTFSRLTLSQATGTAPLTVSSTTVVTNLNADLLDGEQGTAFHDASLLTGNIANARLTSAFTYGTYTPIWYNSNGFNVSVGAGGSITGYYIKIGNFLLFTIYVDIGPNTSAGATGDWSFNLPVISSVQVTSAPHQQYTKAKFFNGNEVATTAYFPPNSAGCYVWTKDDNTGLHSNIGSATPTSWNGDMDIFISGCIVVN